MDFFRILKEIFIEKGNDVLPTFLPKKLTNHYKDELPECYLDEIYIATEYVQIEKILTLYKYHSHREYSYIFEDLLTQLLLYIEDDIKEKGLLIPVPMHWSRYIFRGFDHIGRIVRNLGKNNGYKYFPILSVSWLNIAQHQSKFSRKKRLENKKNTIRIKSPIKSDEVIFLLDDVVSTGSTANECAKILKNNGAKRVVGVFLASNIS